MDRLRVLEILDAEETFERFETLAQALATRGIYVVGGLTTSPGAPDRLSDANGQHGTAPPWFDRAVSR
ncbi:hypothetical protein [Brevundimonas sp. TWP2-3-4b1]|uniref:hypothetical protein n=1 Tax=Brevundimonas sp. TWP2-3-4b1 TaxID=2804580 RepID=UPI003CF77BCF